MKNSGVFFNSNPVSKEVSEEYKRREAEERKKQKEYNKIVKKLENSYPKHQMSEEERENAELLAELDKL